MLFQMLKSCESNIIFFFFFQLIDLNGLGDKIEIVNQEASDLQVKDLPSDQVLACIAVIMAH